MRCWELTANQLCSSGALADRAANGRPIDPRADYATWLAILGEAGLVDTGTHVMRHTAATVMLELGVDVAVVQEILGHADPRTTGGYQQVRVGLQRRAAKKMGQLFTRKTTDLATERRKRRAAGSDESSS